MYYICFFQVPKVLLVIPSVDHQERLPVESQDHVVTQDQWDSLAMWVLLGLQDVKARVSNIFCVYVSVSVCVCVHFLVCV